MLKQVAYMLFQFHTVRMRWPAVLNPIGAY